MKQESLNSSIRNYYAFQFFRDFFFIGGVLIPFFTIWGGISLMQVQFLQSWFMFWVFILEVPTGMVADYFGRKQSIVVGLLFYFFGVLLYGFVPSFYIFLICEMILALGVALMSGADKALIYDTLKDHNQSDQSKKVFGKAQSWKLLALMISAPIGSYIGAKIGLNYPMILSSIPVMISMYFILKIKEPKSTEKVDKAKQYYDIFKRGINFVKENKTVRSLSVNGILVASAGYFVIWLYQPLLLKLNVPISQLGYYHAGLVLAQIFVSSNFVLLEKIFGFKKYLKISALLTSVGFFIACIAPNITTAIVFLVLAGGLGLTRFELIYAELNHHLPSETRATILSTISLFHTLFLVFVNPVVGFLADKSLYFALLLVGTLPLLTFFIKNQNYQTTD